jgi:hypothetical protein
MELFSLVYYFLILYSFYLFLFTTLRTKWHIQLRQQQKTIFLIFSLEKLGRLIFTLVRYNKISIVIFIFHIHHRPVWFTTRQEQNRTRATVFDAPGVRFVELIKKMMSEAYLHTLPGTCDFPCSPYTLWLLNNVRRTSRLLARLRTPGKWSAREVQTLTHRPHLTRNTDLPLTSIQVQANTSYYWTCLTNAGCTKQDCLEQWYSTWGTRRHPREYVKFKEYTIIIIIYLLFNSLIFLFLI